MNDTSLRITSFRLVNFAPLFTSSGITEFAFDRRDSKNSLVLILGANGSGKTFLLTELSPIPLEHIANRTTNRYLPNKEGQKEIVFTRSDALGNDTDDYVCSITYSADKKKTTCHFTHRNLVTGEEKELNDNGNVTSYLDLCKEYLGFDKTYQNIGYMSDDVKNLVGMSYAERQNLMANYIPTTGEFNSAAKIAFKKKGQAQREIDGLLKDIAKISVGDIENTLENQKNALNIKTIKMDRVKDGLSKAELVKSALSRYDKATVYAKKNTWLNRVRIYNEGYAKIGEKLIAYSEYLNGEHGKELLLNKIHDLDLEREKCENQIHNLENEIFRLTNDIDAHSSADNSVSGTFNLISVNSQIVQQEKEIEQLTNDIEPYRERYESFLDCDYMSEWKDAASATTSALMNIALISQKIENLCGRATFKAVFDNTAIRDTDDTIQNLKEMNQHLLTQISEYETQLDLIKENAVDYSKVKQFIPNGCNEKTCTLLAHLISTAKDRDDNKYAQIRDRIQECKDTVKINTDAINEKTILSQNLRNALYDMGQVTEILKTLSDKTLYLPSHIKDEIDSPSPTNVLDNCSKLLEYTQEFEQLVSMLEKRKVTIESIENLKNVSKVLTINDKSRRKLQENISLRNKYQAELKVSRERLDKIQGEKEALNHLSVTINDAKDKRDRLSAEYQAIMSEKEQLLKEGEYVYKLADLNTCISGLKDLEYSLSKDISQITNEIEQNKAKLASLDTLKQRVDTLEKKKSLYELATQIWKEYPQMLVKDFLDEVVSISNKDLDSSWGGLLRIDTFDIQDGVFRIPIIKGDTVIDDASNCSKAERATLDLALSFGIIDVATRNSQMSILRCDEKDSGFDEIRRQSFLETFLDRMRSVNCSNAYVITHSNCFENTKCDVILLKDWDKMISQSGLENKNIIYSIDKSA